MSDQVKRWDSKEHYLNGYAEGVPVSDKVNSWEEAEVIRTRLREKKDGYYYNIVHYTRCAIIETGE